LFLAACGPGSTYHPVVEELPAIAGAPGAELLAFSVAADMRSYLGPFHANTAKEFRAALDALGAAGPGAFLLSPGDIDPPYDGDPLTDDVHAAVQEKLGLGFPWYPVVGNHEAETPGDMSGLRSYPVGTQYGGATDFRAGPPNAVETCFSFSAGGARFIAINEYYDGISDTGPFPGASEAGRIHPSLYAWLESELAYADTLGPDYLFVVGHEPVYPLPDEATGRLRHRGDSLDIHKEEVLAFVDLLKAYDVTAYLCGHTHDYSAALVDGVVQIDAGHARGTGDPGAPSTFLRFSLYDNFAEMLAYRSTDGVSYSPSPKVVRLLPRP
jgi:3',5'-cyclic AMP phosphodiesterase CpdA